MKYTCYIIINQVPSYIINKPSWQPNYLRSDKTIWYKSVEEMSEISHNLIWSPKLMCKISLIKYIKLQSWIQIVMMVPSFVIDTFEIKV
jgi:hypothetical protein